MTVEEVEVEVEVEEVVDTMTTVEGTGTMSVVVGIGTMTEETEIEIGMQDGRVGTAGIMRGGTMGAGIECKRKLR
jgi:hypothetical protein